MAAAKKARRSTERRGETTNRVRYAVVGLGHISQVAMLPAFAHAKKSSELAALVSDDPRKLKQLGKRYGVAALYNYKDLRRCLIEEGIDAVYIATPNSEHLGMIRTAAEVGVHVLCEKPLCVTERECERAVRACRDGGVRLMTAYRLHFEAANLKALEIVRGGTIGEARVFTSMFSYQIKDADNIRLDAALGGGPLHDIGIYCINAARGVFKDEPVEVSAWGMDHGDPRFSEVEATASAVMRFPGDRVATFTCSFALADQSWYTVVGTKGSVRVDPAYEYAEGLSMSVTVGDKTRERTFSKKDQFAAELEYFSGCVRGGREPEPSGEEGLADVRIIEALRRSIRTGRAVKLKSRLRVRYPSPRQRIDRQPVRREPKLVNAESASK